MLHEMARHGIHSSETLEIAVECLLAMCEQHTSLFSLHSPRDKLHEVTYTKIHQALQFRLQVLRSLKARSQANEARLRNEITLVRGTLAIWNQPPVAKIFTRNSILLLNKTLIIHFLSAVQLVMIVLICEPSPYWPLSFYLRLLFLWVPLQRALLFIL